jgi:hypothetical protein
MSKPLLSIAERKAPRPTVNGNAAKIPGLGTFKLRVQGKAKENIDEVTAQGCRAQVVFDVDPKLAAELADAKFAFVTRPTSEGEQDIVDDETPTDNTDTGDNNGGGSEGGNGGLE